MKFSFAFSVMANEAQPPNQVLHHVEYNELGQPIGGETDSLCRFLHSIARNGDYCPLDVPQWHDVPNENKTCMLDLVKSQFIVPATAEKWIMTSIGRKWRGWKYLLKKRYWAKDVLLKHLIHEGGGRVLSDQLIKLITYWNSEDAKEAGMRKKYARVGAVLKLGRPPNDFELFSACYNDSKGDSSADAFSKYLAMQDQLPKCSEDLNGQDDVFSHVKGTDRQPGHSGVNY